jgi:hypothetical protein
MLYSNWDPKVRNNPVAYLTLTPPHIMRIYAHGSLEDKLGYDQVSTDSIVTFNSIFSQRSGGPSKIIEEKVMTYTGDVLDVEIIIWNIPDDSISKICGYVYERNDHVTRDFASDKAHLRITIL